jgi:hypothetical protein
MHGHHQIRITQQEGLVNMDPTTAAIVATAVAGIVAALKQLGMSTRVAPLIALLTGVALVALVLFVPDAAKFLIGLSAAGVYEIAANAAKHSGEPRGN